LFHIQAKLKESEVKDKILARKEKALTSKEAEEENGRDGGNDWKSSASGSNRESEEEGEVRVKRKGRARVGSDSEDDEENGDIEAKGKGKVKEGQNEDEEEDEDEVMNQPGFWDDDNDYNPSSLPNRYPQPFHIPEANVPEPTLSKRGTRSLQRDFADWMKSDIAEALKRPLTDLANYGWYTTVLTELQTHDPLISKGMIEVQPGVKAIINTMTTVSFVAEKGDKLGWLPVFHAPNSEDIMAPMDMKQVVREWMEREGQKYLKRMLVDSKRAEAKAKGQGSDKMVVDEMVVDGHEK
jgi:hypothetical protein